MEKTINLAGTKIYEILKHISYDEPYNNLDNISINNPFCIHKIIGNFFYIEIKFLQNGFFFFYIFLYFLCLLGTKAIKKKNLWICYI